MEILKFSNYKFIVVHLVIQTFQPCNRAFFVFSNLIVCEYLYILVIILFSQIFRMYVVELFAIECLTSLLFAFLF